MRHAFATLALLGFESAVANGIGSSEALGTQPIDLAQTEQEYRSTDWSVFVNLEFRNNSDETVQMYWFDYSGNTRPYGRINQGGSYTQGSYATHPWQARGVDGSTSTFTISGEDVFVPVAGDNNQKFVIEKVISEETEETTQPEEPSGSDEPEIYYSTAWSDPILLFFVNQTEEAVNMFWHDYSGNLRSWFTIQPNQSFQQNTYATHPWSATCASGVQLLTGNDRVFVPSANDDEATIIIRRQEVVSEGEEDSAVEPPTEGETSADSEPQIDHCADNNNDPEHTVSGRTGTIFIDGDWFPEDYESSYVQKSEGYQCNEWVFDRRDPQWKKADLWCFDATFKINPTDTQNVLVKVNESDFPSINDAAIEAQKYSLAVGRLPYVLRRDLKTIQIHAGVEPFGGGNRDILIHTDYAEQIYAPLNNLEETLVHEGAHTSLDGRLYSSDEWISAVDDDDKFSSNYARDHPKREDIAETYLVWFATRYAPELFTEEALADWECYMENRFRVFDDFSCQPGLMYPWPDC